MASVATKQSIVVFGPQGCGKTRNAEVIRKHFKLDKVLDDGSNELWPCYNTLILTNLKPDEMKHFSKKVFKFVSFSKLPLKIKLAV